MRNMKIEVQNNLDEIVGELEGLNYVLVGFKCKFNKNYFVCANMNGYYTTMIRPPTYCKETTLAEPKEMRDDIN